MLYLLFLAATGFLLSGTSAQAQEPRATADVATLCDKAMITKKTNDRIKVRWPMTVVENIRGREEWNYLPVEAPDVNPRRDQFNWKPEFSRDANAGTVLCTQWEYPKAPREKKEATGGPTVNSASYITLVGDARLVDIASGTVIRKGEILAKNATGLSVQQRWVQFVTVGDRQYAMPSRVAIALESMDWICNHKSLPCGGRTYK